MYSANARQLFCLFICGLGVFSTALLGAEFALNPVSTEKLVILGSGPAGLTASLYAARSDLSPFVIEGNEPGGQLMITSAVENFPGFEDPVMGSEIISTLRNQTLKFGTRFRRGSVLSIDFSSSPYLLSLSDGTRIFSKAVIIATGASAKWLGVEGEGRLKGKGVSSCATCDGFFFKDRDIVVVGGGDTAIEEALFLTRFANSVTLVNRSGKLRASKIMQNRARNHPKIKIIYDSQIIDVYGENEVKGVRVENSATGQGFNLSVQGVFVAIGHAPNTDFLKGAIDADEHGYLFTAGYNTLTNVEGVFAAGDVADNHYMQAVTAAASGCRAAIDAEKYLESLEFKNSD